MQSSPYRWAAAGGQSQSVSSRHDESEGVDRSRAGADDPSRAARLVRGQHHLEPRRRTPGARCSRPGQCARPHRADRTLAAVSRQRRTVRAMPRFLEDLDRQRHAERTVGLPSADRCRDPRARLHGHRPARPGLVGVVACAAALAGALLAAMPFTFNVVSDDVVLRARLVADVKSRAGGATVVALLRPPASLTLNSLE